MRNGSIFRFVYLMFLCLAHHVHSATFTVINTNDAGVGSLRQAITDANANVTPLACVPSAPFNTPGGFIFLVPGTTTMANVAGAVANIAAARVAVGTGPYGTPTDSMLLWDAQTNVRPASKTYPSLLREFPIEANPVVNADNYSSGAFGQFELDIDANGNSTPGEVILVTFALYSDDRSQLRIFGEDFLATNSNGTLVNVGGDDALTADFATSNANAHGTIMLTEGNTYTFEAFHTEGTLTSGLEVFYAIGDSRNIMSRSNAFPLVDDTFRCIAALPSNTDIIDFNIPGAGVQTINLTSGLPAIADTVLIDGLTQPTATTSNLLIRLDGIGAGATAGITFSDNSGDSEIRGLIITRFGTNGMRIQGAYGGLFRINNNIIGLDETGAIAGNTTNGIDLVQEGGGIIEDNVISSNGIVGIILVNSPRMIVRRNKIGTDITGLNPRGNGFDGIQVRTAENLIQDNTISANGRNGIWTLVTAVANQIITGNNIGTDMQGTCTLVAGLCPLGNLNVGIQLDNANNLVSGNIISGNRNRGITMFGGTNTVIGNRIGTDVSGTLPIGNTPGGIIIFSANNAIGGTNPGEGNTIAFNQGVGVAVSGNVGTNRIVSNAIFRNDGLGIDLANNGVTANDNLDPDSGSNALQNYPVLATAQFSPTNPPLIEVTGTLNSLASTTFLIQVFSSWLPDPSGFGEGQTLVGEVVVTTNASGNANFSIDNIAPVGDYFTATASRQLAGVPIETSEFSAAILADDDSDGIPNSSDNCPNVPGGDQNDSDHDGLGNICDTCTDTDQDGIGDPENTDFSGCISSEPDNCKFKPNPDQTDTDLDGMGNACDTCASDPADPTSENDSDSDGVCDAADRCPAGLDFLDDDSDSVPNACDNCVLLANIDQLDSDHDGLGDVCDTCTDTDDDGFGDPGSPDFSGCDTTEPDNCPYKANADQTDTDEDGMGNACDTCASNPLDPNSEGDSDNDGVCNAEDRCPSAPDYLDGDIDGWPNACDNCALNANTNQQDSDHDGIGNACDTCTDTDNDGIGDPENTDFSGCTNAQLDNCKFKANPDQIDSDNDGMGNACDTCSGEDDADNDGSCDAADRCPAGPDGLDQDGDGIPDDCDNCPLDANANQRDTDNDDSGDACDGCTDSDDDGFGDPGFNQDCDEDNCPFIANDQEDLDDDGIGDRCDTIPGGATTVPMPTPPFNPDFGGGGGFGPIVDSPLADFGPSITSAPSPEISVTQTEDEHYPTEKVISENSPSSEPQASGCSTTGSVDMSISLLLLVLMRMGLKRRAHRKEMNTATSTKRG